MNFSILEQFILGKKNNVSLCEDAIFINDNFAAVVDGATSKSTFQIEGKSTGRLASELICQGISLLFREMKMKESVNLISHQIFNFYQENNLDKHMLENPQDRFTGCAAIYSHFRNEVWLIGDCQCIIGKTHYSNKKNIDAIISNVRSLFLEMELLKGVSISDLLIKDTGREYIMPLLRNQTKFQNLIEDNNEYAYAVFDGFAVDTNDVKVIKVNDDNIILATDGYPKLHETLKASEMYLKKIISDDPLCMKLFKSTKGIYEGNISYDDRAFLKLKKNPRTIALRKLLLSVANS